MNNIVKKGDNKLISLFHNPGSLDLNSPFEQEILLIDTYIAGTSYVPGFDTIEPLLQDDDLLDFFREADNSEDEYAVLIQDKYGNKLGYLPAKENLIIARLMDAGKYLFGKITRKRKHGSWNFIEIKVYLKD